MFGMVIFERTLIWLVMVVVAVVVVAFLTLPIGCRYCVRAVLFERPVGRDGDVRVFAGEGAYAKSAQQVLTHLPEAKRRVAGLLGPQGIQADIVIAPRDQFGEHVDYAGAMFDRVFGSPVLVLPIDSISTNTTAHELVHAVLENRQNWWRSATDMPVWFNEGLAMQVDYGSSFGVDVLCQLSSNYGWPSYQKLRYPEGFYTARTQQEVLRNYAWAKGAVWTLLQQGSFVENLKAHLQGQPWEAAFGRFDAVLNGYTARSTC